MYGPDFPGETFRVLKEREIKQFGEYRPRRLVLDAWDRLERLEIGNPEGYRGVSAEDERAKVVKSVQEEMAESRLAVTSVKAGAETSRSQSDEPSQPDTQPMLPDFRLYKCQSCEKMVMGFDRKNHVRDVHGGKEVEWRMWEGRMKAKILGVRGISFNRLLVIVILIVLCLVVWVVGIFFKWSWGDFWSNFISNAGSSAIIGAVLYWLITRPDEHKATRQRRDQALAMLKIEFKINLERARTYNEALKSPISDLSGLYPLRFTRGAWNALRESGFLPQLDDAEFVYALLRANEVITVANSSLSTVRRSSADNKKKKLNTYAKKR